MISWLVFGLVLVGAWAVAGPTQLGGPVNYVVVSGTSMEPTYNNGDLVLTRSESGYEVGDVVTYVTESAGKPFPVIHRIVQAKADGASYITQGDNRNEPDDFMVNDDNIVGKTWVHIPYAGLIANFFKTPIGIGLLASLFVFSLLTNGKKPAKAKESGHTDSSVRVSI